MDFFMQFLPLIPLFIACRWNGALRRAVLQRLIGTGATFESPWTMGAF
jgi:hypothetical protein